MSGAVVQWLSRGLFCLRRAWVLCSRCVAWLGGTRGGGGGSEMAGGALDLGVRFSVPVLSAATGWESVSV